MRRRNVKIDVLRLLFALIIVLHHSRYVLGYDESIFIGGSLAVEFYFIVSGYLMMAHLEKKRSAVLVAEQKALGSAAAAQAEKNGGTAVQAEESVGTAVQTEESVGTAGQAEENGGSAVQTEQRVGTEKVGKQKAGSQKIGTETFCFVLGKIRGFLPEFVFSLLIGAAFVGTAEHWGLHGLWRHVVHGFGEYSLLKMSGIYQSGINGVMWYLSAMLLCMAILYPLIRRFPDFMKHVGLPLITILLFGFLCQTDGSPRDPTHWEGIAYKGLFRCMAELSLGGLCFLGCRRLRGYHFNRFGRVLLTLVEVFCYLIPIRYMYFKKPSAEDYFYIFLLFLAIMLSFAERGIGSAGLSNGVEKNSGREEPGVLNRLGSFCAKYSTALFLSHLYFAQHINTIFPEEVYSAGFRMAWYLGLSLVNGLVVMRLSALVRRHHGGLTNFARRLLLAK